MKNMFGILPGARYGWPKNIIHWKGVTESIHDISATVSVNFVIADGIVAMEGNGPLNGTPRLLGKIVLADDPVAPDATESSSSEHFLRTAGPTPTQSWQQRPTGTSTATAVCAGSMRTPKSSAAGSIPAWQQAFFQSEFTHPGGAGRLTRRKGGTSAL